MDACITCSQPALKPACPLAWLVLFVTLALVGCDAPARVKPWRHAPDPVAAAAEAVPTRVIPPDVNATGAAIAAERDHTLRIAIDTQPKQVNPLASAAEWNRRILLGPVYETLIKVMPPEAGDDPSVSRYGSGLARSWRVMPNGLEIRLELEPGVTFHDGRPMSSVDVQFTLDLIRSPRRGLDRLRRLLSDVFAVELITPTQVRLVLLRPSGWALRALAEIPILPAHLHNNSLAAGGRVVGTGPWRVSSWKSSLIHLSRYAGYWGKKPAIDDIEFVHDDDAARTLTAAKRGEIDIVPALIPAHWPDQISAPGIASDFTALPMPQPRFRYVLFNNAAAPTIDPIVRRALSLLIDRSGLAEDVYAGLVVPAGTPVWPGGPVSGSRSAVPPYDPVAAAALLDAAGYLDGNGDGVRERDGSPLSVTVLVVEQPNKGEGTGGRNSPERDRVLDAWRRSGIAVDLRVGSEAVIMRRVVKGDYDAVFMEWIGVADLDVSPWFVAEGSENVARFSSPDVDSILSRMDQVWDPGGRVALAGELNTALLANAPIAVIGTNVPQALISNRVHGIVPWGGWFDLTVLTLSEPTTASP